MYNNILDIKDYFDIFIFDAYGVFWDGGSFYRNAIENIEKLIKDYNKTVCILSNTNQLSKEAEDEYRKHGLQKHIHYNEFITSGEATRNALIYDNSLKQRGLRVWQYGRYNAPLFDGTNYIQVDNIDCADYIYISTPLFTEEKVKKLSKIFGDDVFFESENRQKNGQKMYNTTCKEVFIEDIKFLASKKLPVIISNTDEIASSIDVKTNERHFMIREGTLRNMLKQENIEIIEFGKPNIAIFNFAFKKLADSGIDISSRICMVGDTLKTDILGANNAGIKSVLCVNTGVTKNEILTNHNILEAIKKLEVKTKSKVDYYISSVGGID